VKDSNPNELPVIQGERTEFGFKRTSCACDGCTINCEYMPGYMIPDDLDRIWQFVAPELSREDFARKYLLWSSGATVYTEGFGQFKVPNLVPNTHPESTACIFLDENSRCKIHAVSPFGCAFFDDHMSHEKGLERSMAGVNAIMVASDDLSHPYAQILRLLQTEKRMSPSANYKRELLAKAAERTKMPFAPKSLGVLREQYQSATKTAYDHRIHNISSMLVKTEGLHMLDFENGLRLVVTKETGFADSYPVPTRTVIHVAAEIMNGSYLEQKFVARVRRGSLSPEQATKELVQVCLNRFQEISGYRGQIYMLPQSARSGAPHWFISCEEHGEEKKAEHDAGSV
jgi:hypothetical protein